LGVTLVLAQTLGRVCAYAWMVLPGALAAWVHLVWLPRYGINGWTAEPRERYHRLMEHARLRDLFRRSASRIGDTIHASGEAHWRQRERSGCIVSSRVDLRRRFFGMTDHARRDHLCAKRGLPRGN
jgi:hypothetical protein